MPPQQGFHLHHVARGQVHLGLVVQQQFLTGEGMVQVAFQLEPLTDLGTEGLGIELVGVAAPCALARYMAASAFCSSTLISSPSWG